MLTGVHKRTHTHSTNQSDVCVEGGGREGERKLQKPTQSSALEQGSGVVRCHIVLVQYTCSSLYSIRAKQMVGASQLGVSAIENRETIHIFLLTNPTFIWSSCTRAKSISVELVSLPLASVFTLRLIVMSPVKTLHKLMLYHTRQAESESTLTMCQSGHFYRQLVSCIMHEFYIADTYMLHGYCSVADSLYE